MGQAMNCIRYVLNAGIVSAATVALTLPSAPIEARVMRIVEMSTPTIAFGGYSWAGVGQYEKITGVAYGEIDPADRRNNVIVDLGLAQPQAGPNLPGRTPDGKVAYLLNFYILKPVNLNAVDASLNGRGRVMYEPPNRGGKTWTALGRVTGGGNDPASITNTTLLANSFLMPRGYILVWSGWEELGDPENLSNLTATAKFPVVTKPNGSPITGPSYEYIVTGGASFELAYPAADPADKSNPTLTHRVHLNDAPKFVAAFGSTECTNPGPNTEPNVCWDYNASGTE